ncbi:CCA tRNA nucleotidyltransferase [Roseomonas sp. BN140053]|uniref:CCA tRNA nucleotidyltransferase n=1 Tax=Roseomonas sp. BN140053 TaxID=3391898 RepID=UPI0039EA8DE0
MRPLPDRLREGAAAAVLAALPGARAVGGCVRDALAGRPIADVDVGVPLPPEESSARLRRAGLRVFDTGLSHGTVTAVLDHDPVEVTSLRRDVATDGRHAVVEWTTDWREDAARRDFTVNAMSVDAAGNLWDWFGGRDDLRAGIVRFVGDPATRLREDALRALRFFRFHARYGTGAADPAAVAAIRGAVPDLGRLSVERVWSEIKRLLAAPDPVAAVALMAESGVLGAVLPEATELDGLRALVRLGAPAESLLRLAALLPLGAESAALAHRLRLSNEEAGRLATLVAGEAVPRPGASAGDVAAWRHRAGFAAPGTDAALALWLAEARDGADRAALRAEVAAQPPPRFPLAGRDALALGVRPGPRVGAVLRAVEEWWLAGGCVAGAEACRARLAEVIAVIGAANGAGGRGTG